MTYQKGQKVRYTSGSGNHFSAWVKIVHRDGSYTVEVAFALRDGKELPGYQGDRFRVWDNQLSDVWTPFAVDA